MAGRIATDELVKTVASALQSVAPDVEDISAATPLTGEDAVIDSVGLVSLLVTLEESLQQRLKDSPADQQFELPPLLLQQESGEGSGKPFRTVGSLAEHIAELVSSNP